MKITHERFEITPRESFAWQDVKTMRLLNDKLVLVLSNGHTIQVPNLLPSTIDLLFRTFDNYLHTHPHIQ